MKKRAIKMKPSSSSLVATKKITTTTAILAVTLVIAAAMVFAFSTAVQEVHAQAVPAKAQAILASEPSERGAVASGGQGGKPCDFC
jgi:hypothetical protein